MKPGKALGSSEAAARGYRLSARSSHWSVSATRPFSRGLAARPGRYALVSTSETPPGRLMFPKEIERVSLRCIAAPYIERPPLSLRLPELPTRPTSVIGPNLPTRPHGCWRRPNFDHQLLSFRSALTRKDSSDQSINECAPVVQCPMRAPCGVGILQVAGRAVKVDFIDPTDV
jgi:hypothetical protein